MGRDRLEAAIWQAMRTYQVTCLAPVRFVGAVLRAAGRRAALTDAVRGESTATHFGTTDRACGGRPYPAGMTGSRTDDPAKVTCRRCMQTIRYRAAAAEAS
jgi:hypothetical protein